MEGTCSFFLPLGESHPLNTDTQTFWDATGGQWASGGFYGKSAGLFISTATHGGGQESTAIAAMSTLAHHGIAYIPLGYGKVFPQLTNLKEVHGGECSTSYSIILAANADAYAGLTAQDLHGEPELSQAPTDPASPLLSSSRLPPSRARVSMSASAARLEKLLEGTINAEILVKR